MDLIKILNDINNSGYKSLSDLEMNKKYKILDGNVKFCEKFEKYILYPTLELDGGKYEVPIPDRYYYPFKQNWELDPKLLANEYVKLSPRVFTPKDCTTSRVYYTLEFSSTHMP